MLNYQVISLFTVAIINALFAFFIIGKGEEKNNTSATLFSLITVAISMWALNIAFFIQYQYADSARIFLNVYYVSAAFIPVLFLYFSMTFFGGKKIRPLIGLTAIPLLAFILFLFYQPNLLVTTILSESRNVQFNRYTYLGYSIYFVIFVLWTYGLLVHKLIHEKTHAQRSQLILVIVGTAIAFLFGMYFNLILPWLNVYEYIWLGPCFSLIMIFSMGYTIIRHNLFNIKIVTTKISVFLILFFIFIRFLITDGVEEKVIEVTLFVVTTIAGMFLIKSVEKEIDAREEIEALVGRLKIANEHLRELDKQKTEFVSIASHQLRTPLTAIKGYVSMILDGSFGALEEGVKEPVKRIFHSSERLSGTVEDFLNVTRIEQGRMQYEMMDTDICSLTKEAVEELTYAAEEKHISLSLVCDLKEYAISADREKLRQVVLNLIDNAIKYTPKGGVSVHVFEKTTGRRTFAVIEISDTGIGIPYTFMNEIFGKFNRGENSPMYYANGSGIGLYIANEIVRAHHGAIEVKSKEGEGAVFSVMLPQKNSPISETRESPEDVEKVKKEQTNK